MSIFITTLTLQGGDLVVTDKSRVADAAAAKNAAKLYSLGGNHVIVTQVSGETKTPLGVWVRGHNLLEV